MRHEYLSSPEKESDVKVDALVILCPVMQINETGTWEFPIWAPFQDGSTHYAGGEIRISAALAALQAKMTKTILVTGGTELVDGTKYSRAKELERTLKERSTAIEDAKIIAIGRDGSNNTLGNAQDVIHYLEENGSSIKSLGILTGATHIRRAMEIFQRQPYFDENGIALKQIVAETYLRQKGLLNRDTIASYLGHAKSNLIPSERNGYNALRQGTYGNKQKPI